MPDGFSYFWGVLRSGCCVCTNRYSTNFLLLSLLGGDDLEKAIDEADCGLRNVTYLHLSRLSGPVE